MDFIFVLAVGLVAGTISGIVGTGSSIMLMPVLVYQYGPKQAVPIMAVAAVMANLSRILAWWREVDWRACAAYSVDGTNPCGAHGWARGPRLGQAQNEALRGCYKDGGRDCVIRTFICDAKD